MKVTIVMVASVDGKTTRHNVPDIYHWTSLEDQKHFFSLIAKHKVIVMGRATYEAARLVMKLKPGKLRLVMTRHPEKFASQEVPGQLEFTDKSPKAIVADLEKKGYRELLLAGGGSINTMFLKAGLVDELYLTIEPKLFGIGNQLISDKKLDVSLSLQSVEKLNSQGTLLLKYKVI